MNPQLQRPTGAFIGASWGAFFVGAVVYLVGTFGNDQPQLHATSAGVAAQAAAAGGAQAFVYLSSLAADLTSDGTYASTKAQGEQLVRAAFPRATVVRPSIVFGQDDQFIAMFAGLIASLPALPVFGPEAKLQPVWVDDVARAITTALADPATHGGKKIFGRAVAVAKLA